MDWIKGKRTYIVAAVTFLAALIPYLTDMPIDDGKPLSFFKSLLIALASAALVTLRLAIKNGGGGGGGGNDSAAPPAAGGSSAVAPLIGLLLLAAVAVQTGCAGPRARDGVLMPALQLAAPQVWSEAEKGLPATPPSNAGGDQADIEAMRQAFAAGDRPGIIAAYRLHWPGVREAALLSIEHKQQSGEVGPTVASSLRERIFRFEEDLEKLSGPAIP